MDVRRLTLLFGGVAIVVAVAMSGWSLMRAGWGGREVGGAFSLVDHQGRETRPADFRGRHMLVFFGYTSCPDVCPSQLLVVSEALDQLGEAAAGIQPVFITVDPERDTPEVLADYRRHFHASLVALTGSPAEVAKAARAYRVRFAKTPGDDGDDYLMDHTSLVFLMDPSGRYVKNFGPEVGPEEMAAGLREAL